MNCSIVYNNLERVEELNQRMSSRNVPSDLFNHIIACVELNPSYENADC